MYSSVLFVGGMHQTQHAIVRARNNDKATIAIAVRYRSLMRSTSTKHSRQVRAVGGGHLRARPSHFYLLPAEEKQVRIDYLPAASDTNDQWLGVSRHCT